MWFKRRRLVGRLKYVLSRHWAEIHFWDNMRCLIDAAMVCIALSLTVVSSLSTCGGVSDDAFAVCADTKVAYAAFVILHSLGAIGILVIWWCTMMLCRKYNDKWHTNFSCETLLSICMLMRSGLMSGRRRLPRCPLLPQQIFFLLFTLVYTVFAVWLQSTYTVPSLHNSSVDSGF